jgi:hypothetical protein
MRGINLCNKHGEFKKEKHTVDLVPSGSPAEAQIWLHHHAPPLAAVLNANFDPQLMLLSPQNKVMNTNFKCINPKNY